MTLCNWNPLSVFLQMEGAQKVLIALMATKLLRPLVIDRRPTDILRSEVLPYSATIGISDDNATMILRLH